MIKTNRSLQDAKRYINALKGKNLEVQVNLGRNKSTRYSGKLTSISASEIGIITDALVIFA